MLFIKNHYTLSEIVFENYANYAEKSAFSVVKKLCETMLFSYESRIKLTKKTLNINVRLPLYINKEMLLIPTKASKDYQTVWLNYFHIIKLIKRDKSTEVVFSNLSTIKVDVSYNILSNSLINAKKILKYFQKNDENLFLKSI